MIQEINSKSKTRRLGTPLPVIVRLGKLLPEVGGFFYLNGKGGKGWRGDE